MTDPYIITIAALYALGAVEYLILAHTAKKSNITVSGLAVTIQTPFWPILIIYALFIGILDTIKSAKDRAK
jgi:hypothetical protein